ncbi:hypothetical protein CAL20_19250 [Bordetella genomosp. 4]|uniref:Uncharacterized protein n=1 Tax=Bordetella genomosp. 4 TaxID=463044 RepID=A0A261TTY6_9BORD|nr:hypothetical protein CAL20_19250 [Bordetella genomosp. 4]
MGSTVAVCTATVYTIMGAGTVAPVTQYEAGAQIDAGRWQVVPHRAWVSKAERVYGVRLQPGQQALVVEVDLNNRSASSSRAYNDTLKPKWPAGAKPENPDVALLRDSKMIPLLHPGMPERVAYVWVLSGSVSLPEKMPIEVIAKTYKPVDNLYGTPLWTNPKVIGQFTLPLDPAPAPATSTPAAAPSAAGATERAS